MKENPKPLKDLVEKALSRPELLKAAKAIISMENWATIVGEILCKKCKPNQYDHGVLHVTVNGSTWAQELQMQKGKILKRLNENAGEGLFQDIRFKVGKVENSENESNFVTFDPIEIDINFAEKRIENIGRKALGRLKAASAKQDTAKD